MKKITFILLLAMTFYTYSQNTCASAVQVSIRNYNVPSVDGDPPPINCINHSNGNHGEWL